MISIKNTALAVVLCIFSTSLAADWDYNQKVAAQNKCGEIVDSESSPEFYSCVIGVTVYGDGRSPYGGNLRMTPERALNNCNAVCVGTGKYSSYCKRGCEEAKATE